MSDALTAVPFTPELLDSPTVQAFDSGKEEWEQEIGAWLKARAGGAADDVLKADRHVWLYATPEREIGGIGGIGHGGSVRWPKSKSPAVPATCITWLAVDVRLRNRGYGQQILDHLLAEAVTAVTERPLVVLYVHTANSGAIRCYEREGNGFVKIGKPYKENDKEYHRMVLDLSLMARPKPE